MPATTGSTSAFAAVGLTFGSWRQSGGKLPFTTNTYQVCFLNLADHKNALIRFLELCCMEASARSGSSNSIRREEWKELPILNQHMPRDKVIREVMEQFSDANFILIETTH